MFAPFRSFHYRNNLVRLEERNPQSYNDAGSKGGNGSGYESIPSYSSDSNTPKSNLNNNNNVGSGSGSSESNSLGILSSISSNLMIPINAISGFASYCTNSFINICTQTMDGDDDPSIYDNSISSMGLLGGSVGPASGSGQGSALPQALQYDSFSKEWSQISQQDTFDGFRLEAGKTMNKYLQMSHTLLLGTCQRNAPYNYQAGPIFQSESGRTFLMAKYSLDGMLNVRGVKKLCGNNCDIRFNGGSSLTDPQRNIIELSNDWTFNYLPLSIELSNDWTFNVWALSWKLVYQGVWIANVNFSRKISNNFSLGGELTYLNLHCGASMGTLSARWVIPNTGVDGGSSGSSQEVISCTLGRTPDFRDPYNIMNSLHGLRIQYVNKVSDRVSIGTEIDYTYPEHDSASKIAYEYTFRTSRVQGLLDTSGRVSCFVNDFKGYALSAMIDYVANDYRFGMLVHYYPVGEEVGAEGGGGGEPMMM